MIVPRFLTPAVLDPRRPAPFTNNCIQMSDQLKDSFSHTFNELHSFFAAREFDQGVERLHPDNLQPLVDHLEIVLHIL